MTISAAFSFYGDFDYLEKCLERVAPVADEIVLLDGPFRYAVPLLQSLGLYYEEPGPKLQELIDRFEIKYAYQTFENESEKRIALYRMCSCDVVFLVDADELLDAWSPKLFNRFLASDCAVAPLRLTNMCRDGYRFGDTGFKYILFKRDRISAEAHLNYTWLVGCVQEEPDRSLMLKEPIGGMSHYTLRRSMTGNAIKYAFYTSLWKAQNAPEKLGQIGALPGERALKAAGSVEKLRQLFTRSMPEMLNIHTKEGSLKAPETATQSPEREIDRDNRAPLANGNGLALLPSLPRLAEIEIPRRKRAGSEIRFSFDADPGLQITCRACLRFTDINIWVDVTWQDPQDGDAPGTRHGVFTLPQPAEDLFAALLEFKVAGGGAELVEIADFHLKKSLLIHGNCQSESFAECLASNPDFRKRYWWIPTPGRLVHMQSIPELEAFYDLAIDADCFIVQQVSDNYRGDARYGTRATLDHVGADRQVILYPNMFFNGYNPGVYVVRNRDDQILQRPMPVHDVNMIYTMLRCDMDKDAARAAYLDLVRNPEHPVGLRGMDFCQASIDELRRRVQELHDQFGDRPNVTIFDYAALIETLFDQFVTHYSDAHPVERTFEVATAALAVELGLPDAPYKSTATEKGALPVPASVKKAIGLKETENSLHINNREVSLEQLTSRYLDSYDGMGNEELYGYIARDTARFVITNHKTGTRSMENFVRRYCELIGKPLNIYKNDPKGVDYTKFGLTLILHSQHLDEVLREHPDLRYRAVHLYREACDVITSGAYYHTVTDESWCRAPVFRTDPEVKWKVVQEGNFVRPETQKPEYRSYQQVISDLPVKDQLLFEIDKLPTTFDTIKSMARFMERFEQDGNVQNLRLNTISTAEGFQKVFRFLDLDPAHFDESWNVVNWWKGNFSHSTPPTQKSVYKDSFDADCRARLLEVHAKAFKSTGVRDTLFGAD